MRRSFRWHAFAAAAEFILSYHFFTRKSTLCGKNAKDGTLFQIIPAEAAENCIDNVIRSCDTAGIVTLDDMVRCPDDSSPMRYCLVYDANAQTVFDTGGGPPTAARHPARLRRSPKIPAQQKNAACGGEKSGTGRNPVPDER